MKNSKGIEYMVPRNPDIFKQATRSVEYSKPFFQPNTIIRPENLDHEPYINHFRENYRNTANTTGSNYSVPGPRSDIAGYNTNFNKEVRQLKPESELLWSASGEIINTSDGRREPNFLNTSVGSYATVTTEDGKSFYSNTPVSTGPGMKGTTINNGLGGLIIYGNKASLPKQGPISEGFSDIPKIDIVDFPKIPKPGLINISRL